MQPNFESYIVGKFRDGPFKVWPQFQTEVQAIIKAEIVFKVWADVWVEVQAKVQVEV